MDRIGYIDLKDPCLPYLVAPQVLMLSCNELSDAEKVTFLAMMSFDWAVKSKGPDGEVVIARKGYCDVSIAELAKYRGISAQSIRRHLIRLEEFGLIKRDGTPENRSTKKDFNLNILVDRNAELKVERSSFKGTDDDDSIQKCGSTPTNLEEGPLQKRGGHTLNNNKEVLNERANTPVVIGTVPSLENTTITSTKGATSLDYTSDELDPSFANPVSRTPMTETPKPKTKKARPKNNIEAGAIDEVKAKDLLEYFQDTYEKVYHRPYVVPYKDHTGTLSLLNNSLLNRYGPERSVEIIDLLFRFYEGSELCRPAYPRPTIVTLTQNWIVDKLMDMADNVKKLEAAEEDRRQRETRAAEAEQASQSNKHSLAEVDSSIRRRLLTEGLWTYIQAYFGLGQISIEILNQANTEEGVEAVRSLIDSLRATA